MSENFWSMLENLLNLLVNRDFAIDYLMAFSDRLGYESFLDAPIGHMR